jgi:xanthine dehydrogenase accessory factor
MFVHADGRAAGTVGGGHLEELCIADAQACLARGTSAAFTYPLGPKTGQCCGGTVDVLVEVVAAGPVLLLFGAGHVGQALCRVLEGTPFKTQVVDERDEWIGAAAIPASVTRHHAAWDDVAGTLPWDAARTYVAIMTHRHDVDQEIVAYAIARPARYVGLIGSATKWARFQARLRERGVGDEALARVKCPIGLDVGGKSPAEVAISAAAELLKVFHGR